MSNDKRNLSNLEKDKNLSKLKTFIQEQKEKFSSDSKVMTRAQRKKCHKIIHSAAVAASSVGAGLAQIPGSDSAIIVPIQVSMTIALGGVFGLKLDQSAAKSAIATGISTQVGRGISQWLVGWIPGFGNAVNATTAFAVTEGLGWILANEFAGQALEKMNR